MRVHYIFSIVNATTHRRKSKEPSVKNIPHPRSGSVRHSRRKHSEKALHIASTARPPQRPTAEPAEGGLAVQWWPLTKISRYKHNPRICPPEAVEGVAASIRAFGWKVPLVVYAGRPRPRTYAA